MQLNIDISFCKIFLVILIYIFILSTLVNEGFHYPYPQDYPFNYPHQLNTFYANTHNLNPMYYNYYQKYYEPIYGYPTRIPEQTRFMYPTRFMQPTRYMNHDLRCDPVLDEPKRVRLGPWGESVILPPYREKCLKMR